MTLRRLLVPLLLLALSGCSTLKGWFTPQGQLVTQAQALADQGHPLGASSLALEALVLEPEYREARALLDKTFAPGQQEYRAEESRWTLSSSPGRWDELYKLYRWQQVFARSGSQVSPAYQVEPVDDKQAIAARGAAAYHLGLGDGLLQAAPGPRQARKALAEGRTAAGYDPTAPGLAGWLETAEAAATQKLLVVPFFFEGSPRLGPLSGPLGSLVSRQLVEGPLPELTTVFPSDRLVTLPNGGLARLGLISQPDALKMAADAGQNLVLMGQITKAAYQEPRVTVKNEAREKKVVIVDPTHPQGVEKVYRAALTTKKWTTSAVIAASFSVIEAPTNRDLVTAIREARTSDEAVETTFTGDREALGPEDLLALEAKAALAGPDELWARTIEALATQVSAAVRDSLR